MTTGSLLDYLGEVQIHGPEHTAFTRPADHKEGVGYFAPWEDPYAGFPEHCRRSVMALASAGVPVHLRSFAPTFINDTRDQARVRNAMRPLLETSVAAYFCHVHQFVPNEATCANLVTHRFFEGHELRAFNRTKVAYIVLERDRVSETMATALRKLGQVWVTCVRNKDALADSGVHEERIRVVELPFTPNDPLLDLRKRTRPNDVPRFYHIGKWEPRKAQDKLLLAWFRAFKPREAKLTVKTGAPFFPQTPGYARDVTTAVRQALEDPIVRANGWTEAILAEAGVRIVATHVSSADLLKLHTWGDVYLSLSHGEGWDMPAFDAMLAGNTVCFTASGGPERFLGAHAGHVEVPLTSKIPAHPCYQWEKEARYWDYCVDDAVTSMRVSATIATKRVPADMPLPTHCASVDVGARMLSYLKELV